MMKKKLPKGMLGALGWVFSPKRMSTKAPMSPMPMPMDFIQVMGSFKNTAVKTNNNTGVKVITTELLMGVESSNPLKNMFMFSTIPKKAQANILQKSFLSNFSVGYSKLMSQKSKAAPLTRKRIKP